MAENLLRTHLLTRHSTHLPEKKLVYQSTQESEDKSMQDMYHAHDE